MPSYVHGDTPYLVRGEQTDLRRLFYSEPANALTLQVSMPSGYGFIPTGAVMGKITEAASPRKGMWVPYTPEMPVAGEDAAIAAAPLLINGAADKLIEVTLEASYKLAVGDHLAIADSTNYAGQGAGAKDLGPITAIDRTTYPHKAIVTMTNDVGIDYTVARGARVWVQTRTDAPFTRAAGILIGGVDTGQGEPAKGAMGVILLSHAMLYAGSLHIYDAEARADLGCEEHGQYVVFK